MSFNFSHCRRFLLLAAACAPLTIAACASETGPWPMPSGYTHHKQRYKAPPGPEAPGYHDVFRSADGSVETFTVPTGDHYGKTEVTVFEDGLPHDEQVIVTETPPPVIEAAPPPVPLMDSRSEPVPLAPAPPQLEGGYSKERWVPAPATQGESLSAVPEMIPPVEPAPQALPDSAPVPVNMTGNSWREPAEAMIHALKSDSPRALTDVRLTPGAGMPPDMESSLEAALRHALEAQGIATGAGEGGVSLYYAARALNATDPGKVLITLRLQENGVTIAENSAVHTLTP